MNKFFDSRKKEKLNWKYFYILLEYLVETSINNEYLSKMISNYTLNSDFNDFALKIVQALNEETNMEEDNFVGSLKILNVIYLYLK
jgi:hypothetical protein